MELLRLIVLHAIVGSSMAKLRKRGLQAVGEVTKLVLIDAYNDHPFADQLLDGSVIYLNGNEPNFNIEAITTGSVDSVKFGFDGDADYRVENAAAYALCGNSGSNFKTCDDIGLGNHTVSATPFSGNNAGGDEGSTVTITFFIDPGSQASPTTQLPTTTPTAPPPTTMNPTNAPSTTAPTKTPTKTPTQSPATMVPTDTPITASPTKTPTITPASAPTGSPPTTMNPTNAPTTKQPTTTPTMTPTTAPITQSPSASPLTSQCVGQVTDLLLIDAGSDQTFVSLVDGADIYLDGTSYTFNIDAITTGLVESVKFGFDGNPDYRGENGAPYALCGNSGSDFKTCDDLGPGTHTVSATPFSGDNASGCEGSTVTITFTIYAGSEPTPTTPSPTTFTSAPSASPTTSQPVALPPPGTEWEVVDEFAPIEARHEACFVTVGRKAYLIGGRGNKRMDVYDFVNKSWSIKTKPPQLLHHMQCVAAQGKLYILGAWTGGFPEEQNAKQWVYDPVTDIWTELAPMIPGRERGSAAVIVSSDETKIYVSHGNNGGHEKDDFAVSLPYLDEYDIASNSWTALSDDAPNPRDHTGGALVNGRICVAGGRNGGVLGWPSVAPTDCYDLSTGTWSEEADIPNPRGGSAYGTSCDGHLVIAAGEGKNQEGSMQVWDNVEVFNGTHWSALPSLNVARHGTGLAIDCYTSPYEIHIASGNAKPRSGLEVQHHERLLV